MLHLTNPPDIENSGIITTIATTPEEYKAKKLEIGQIVTLDIPSIITDIILDEQLNNDL